MHRSRSDPRRRSRRLGPLAGLALLLASVGCATAPADPGRWVARAPLPELADPPTFPSFAKHPVGWPALSSGRAGLPIMVFDPNVYVDEEGYHLFFTTPFCRDVRGLSYTWDPARPAACDIIDATGSIAYAFSRDRGQTWTHRRSPVVLPSRSGFDSAKIETAHVVRIRDTLYMTYSADGELASRYQIGLASLPLHGRSVREALLDESVEFDRRDLPLLGADLRPGRFDHNVQEPSVVVHDGHLELYYIALGLVRPEAAIDARGQAITSVALGRAVLDLEWNVLERSDRPLMEGVNITEVHRFDGRYHLFASTLVPGEFHHEEEITYASSEDGRSFTPQRVILSPQALPGFDNWGMMAPTAAVERDRVVLFYTAYQSAPGRCYPVPQRGRFGKPVDGGRQCLYATLGRAVSSRAVSPPP